MDSQFIELARVRVELVRRERGVELRSCQERSSKMSKKREEPSESLTREEVARGLMKKKHTEEVTPVASPVAFFITSQSLVFIVKTAVLS